MHELTGKLAYMVGFTANGNPIVTLELNEKTPVKLMIGPGFNNDKSEKSSILDELKKSES